MFYDCFEKLCKERDKTPAQVRKELGISQSTMGSWKSRGLTPNAATLMQLADYFETTVDVLLGKTKGSDSIKFSNEILYLFRLLDMPNFEALTTAATLIREALEIFLKVNGKVDETTKAEVDPAVFRCYVAALCLREQNIEENIHTLRRKYSDITGDVKSVLDSFQHLNPQGKRAAIQRVKELTYVPQYQNETTP